MSNSDEIRWLQRFENFEKALVQLRSACEKDSYTDLERAGLIQTFEFTFELAWKTLKNLLYYQGFDVTTPREVIRQAFAATLLDEAQAEALLGALNKRNLLAHTYRESLAKEAEKLIKHRYYPALSRLEKKLSELAEQLYEQLARSDALEATIKKNLEVLGYPKFDSYGHKHLISLVRILKNCTTRHRYRVC